MRTLDDMLSAPNVVDANRKHDQEHGSAYDMTPVRSGWNTGMMVRRGPLTDRQIVRYEKGGYYSAEFRSARRELWNKKAARQAKRDGNFDVLPDGRMIYRP